MPLCFDIFNHTLALGDGLNFEGLLYEIETHVYFPGAILSPGYLTEVATKPQIATEIEGTVTPQPPEEHAGILIRGVYIQDRCSV